MAKFTFSSPDGAEYEVEGPEGATQEQAFQILKQQMLRPAFKDDKGQVVTGNVGDRHDDIKDGIPEEHRGFVDLKGNFLGRKEAGDLAKSMGMDVPDEMHTADLNKNTGVGTTDQKPSKYAQAMKNIRESSLPEWSKNKALADLQERERRETSPVPASFDPVGDVGKAAAPGIKSIANDLSPMQRENRARENVRKFGPVMGNIKDMLDSAAEGPRAVGSVLGIAGAPAASALHNTAGNLLSFLPGMDRQSADELVDRASMFAAPETMELGLNAPGRMVDMIKGAPQAASADVDAQNAAARAAKPEFAKARDAGYVIHPADVTDKPGMVADATSGLGGKIKTQQAASARNQEITNKIAAQELGLPADTKLDETTFKAVRAKAGDAYKTIEKSAASLPRGAVQADVGFSNAIDALDTAGHELRRDFPELGANPDIAGLQKSLRKPEFSPKAGVEAIKRLRFQAAENLKAIGNPEKKELGMAQRAASNALEELMERRITQGGNAQAISDFRAARQMIAKSHDIEAVTDAAGNVDARALARLGDKRPLTGGLRLIADTAERFPKSMQVPSKVGGQENLSIFDMAWMASHGGSALGGLATGNHAWAATEAALAAGPLARQMSRTVALSDWLQNRLLGLRKQPGNLGPMLKQGALPAMGGTNAMRTMLPPPQPVPQVQQGQ